MSKRVRTQLDKMLVLLTVDKQSILADIDITEEYYDDLYDRVSRLHDLLLLKELSN